MTHRNAGPLAPLSVALILFAGTARADSASQYSSGNYTKVPGEVKQEMASGFDESQEFIATLRLATNSFAQDPRVALQELLSVYDSAAAPAKKFQYAERLSAERAEVSDWLGREQQAKASEVIAAVNAVVTWPENTVDELKKKSSRLFALALLARRKILSEKPDPEWYFVAGKALDADTGSGDAFLEVYLEQPASKELSHRPQALALIEKVYQRRYDGQPPLEIRSKLKRWKNAVVPTAKKKTGH